MTWAFQLVVHLSGRVRGETDQTWTLPEPVRLVHLSASGTTLLNEREVTFRSGRYDTENAARSAGRTFGQWLRVAGALAGVSLFLGTGNQTSWVLGYRVASGPQSVNDRGRAAGCQ